MFKQVLLLLLSTALTVSAVTISAPLAEWGLRLHFQEFEAKFSKTYETPALREERFLIFVKNLEEVVRKNEALAQKGLDQIHGLTKFSDWTADEFADMVSGVKREPRRLEKKLGGKPLVVENATVAVPTVKVTPLKFDWRDQGVITPVKDQGRCGSCWAHSAAESIESQFALHGGQLTSLSVQQIVSCDTKSNDNGCDGGMYNTAWLEYATKGLTTEEEYPYDFKTSHGHPTKCDTEKIDVVEGTEVTSYNWATAPCETFFCRAQDEDTLVKNLVSYGPLSIAVDASQWSSYTGGILSVDSCATSSAMKLDHAVQLVGYDFSVPGQEYFIVKNSWNTDWGYDGYVHLKAGANTCGFADMPAFVTIDQQGSAEAKIDNYKGFQGDLALAAALSEQE
mmetsp:Transcript_27350/g.83956  ORF Transcript_27350/g.83956 Transcript_27350/m.83956 type:complete len:395 (+) Transcript_27350:97-1281(+)